MMTLRMFRLWLAGLALVPVADAANAETILRRGNGSEIESLDPARQETFAGLHVALDAFEGLTDYGADGTVSGRIADHWEISADQRTYVFHLRPTARWSNGNAITAEDFVYSWRRALDPKTASPFAFFLDRIKGAKEFRSGKNSDPGSIGVKALDSRRLQVELENPTPYFLAMLRAPVTFAVHRETIEKHGEQWTKAEHFVGSGPYRLTEWIPNVRMTFSKNPHYWDAANVKIDQVVFYPVEDAIEELELFTSGELDLSYTVPDDKHEELLDRFPGEYRVGPYFGTYYFQFNLKSPPFDDVRIRRALAMAIDRETLVKDIAKGGEVPAYGLVPPGVPGYANQSADFRSMSAEQRLAEAAAIMDSLGYSPANPLKIEILFNTSTRHKSMSEAVRAMWTRINVEATLVEADYKTVLDRRRSGHFQVNRASWIGDYVDPATFLDNLTIGAQQNDARYDNPVFSSLVERSYREGDNGARMKSLQEAEALMLEELPITPLFHYVSKRLVSKRVKGWENNVLGFVLTRTLSKDE